MNEKHEQELKALFDAARVAPQESWEARTVAAMMKIDAPGARWRFQPLANAFVVALVILAFACGPYSNRNSIAIGQALAAQEHAVQKALAEEVSDDELDARKKAAELQPYRERAEEFVRQRYPNDSAMLMAAGVLTADQTRSLAILKEAAEKGNQPLLWAVYVSKLLESGPVYQRAGTVGADPGDLGYLERAKVMLPGIPQKLSPAEAAPILDALRRWQAVDPENALPVAFETGYLYGLHEDKKAFETWKRAGRLPIVDEYSVANIQSIARLLIRMGMGKSDALLHALEIESSHMMDSFFHVRQAARISNYEGRLAQMQGRPQDAVDWWQGTIDLGLHMQDSADSILSWLVGMAVEAIGTSNVWKWRKDPTAMDTSGPTAGGMVYFGKQHDFYVRQVGVQKDTEVREALIRTHVRKYLYNQYATQTYNRQPMSLSPIFFHLASVSLMLLVVLLILFGIVSIRARREADQACPLRLRSRILYTAIIFVPLVSAYGIALWRIYSLPQRYQPAHDTTMYMGMNLTLVLILLLSVILAIRCRRHMPRFRTAWRGSLRKVLPPAIVVCALLSLGFVISERIIVNKWLNEWLTPGYSEMAKVKAYFGEEWEKPGIPDDSWRAEYPPKLQ